MTAVRFVFLALLGLLASGLGGCWDYVDLERESLVMGIGVDLDPDDPEQLKLSVEVPVPAAAEPGGEGVGGGDMQPKLVASATGISLIQAGNKLRGELERHPLWAQVVAVVVSEQVARDGIGRIADVIMRFNDFNLRTHLYIVEGDAEEVLNFTPVMQPVAALHLRGLAEQFPVHPLFPRPRAFVLVHRELRDKHASLVPRLTMESGQLRMEGAGVLSSGRLVGWLDAEQAEGVNWIRGWLKRSLVQFECPGHTGGHIAAWVQLDHHRIRTTAADALPQFRVELSVSARLVDMSRCPLVPEHKPDEEKIARALIGTVSGIAEASVHRAQEELRVDFFGLGEQWRRNYPALAAESDWEQLFPGASIEIKVDMSPTGIGFPGQLRQAVPYR